MDRVARRGPLARAPGALTSHNAEKNERGDPLRFFNIHSVAKHEKNEEKFFIFGKKSHNAEKNWKEEPFEEKNAEKNWKGGLFGLARYGMLRGKTGKTILVQFARPNSAIWHHNIL